ncbi:MAG: arabinogalactan endo-beta-1,4-galactanase [Candidatus Aquirickettsiella gammari]
MKKVMQPFHLIAFSLILLGCGGASSIASTNASAPASTSTGSVVPAAGGFAKGADVSWVTEMEAAGIKFYNKAGIQKDLLEVLKEQGMDSIRLRVWVNPVDGKYNNMTDVIAKAKRVQAAGMRLMIDFHYSDTWADPDKQIKPAQWKDYSVDQLVAALADHTRSSLMLLRDAGITPEWVQVGNETDNGMLWEEGRATTNMKNYARLVGAGYAAVKEVFPQTLVIVHVSNCFDNVLFQWNIGGIKSNGGKFDVIGASAYPFYDKKNANWQASNDQCLANLNDMVTRFNVPVMIVETGTTLGSADAKAILSDLIRKVRSVKEKKGLGILYWEPQAYGNWKGYTLGAFDQAGKPTSAMDAFLE